MFFSVRLKLNLQKQEPLRLFDHQIHPQLAHGELA